MSELLIAAGPGEWRAAWIEQGEPVELYVERGDTKPPGSIHLGQVVRVVRALDAAFVDIGDPRPALLPLRDAEAAALTEGARVLVQVRREAWADKAPRLTAKIAAADLPALAEQAARLNPPEQLLPAPGLAAALRLRLPTTPARIAADDIAVLAELRAAFPAAEIAQHTASDSRVDLDAVFEEALAATVALHGGGSAHFEEARTATLIDVDTGAAELGSAERAALAVNRAAAALIARQLRLRNISGAIVVDFVGLDRRASRDRLRQSLEAALAADPAKPQVLGWTRLGHIEIVRPRRGRSLADAMLEMQADAPAVKQALAVAHEALHRLSREARANPAANWRLSVSAPVETALHGPAAAALRALEARLGRRIAIATATDREGFDIVAI